MDLNALEAAYTPIQIGYGTQPTPRKTSGRGGTPTSLISEGGALGGAAIGAGIGSIVPVVGTAIGGIIGAGLGAFGGRIAENKVRDDRWGLGDAAKEGALSTVLAGPLKLGKYGFTAAKGLKAGAGLEKALVSAAEGATKSSIKSAAGKSLSGAADNLAVKQFRFTPSQLKNFKTKFGEDAGQVVRKYGFNSAEDIANKGITPLQQQFDNLVSGIGGVPKENLKKNLYADISKLTKSASTDNMALGKSLKAEADQLLKRYGDSVDAKDLNVIRREFDSLVNYTQKTVNPARYGVNKRIADALRKTLQESDQSGSLKNVGRELQKLRQLSDNALQQAELGRGGLPFGLGLMPGAIFGVGGGPGGAAAGMLAQNIVNSPKGRQAMMAGVQKVGSRLSNPTVNGIRSAVSGAARGQIGEGIINGSANPSASFNVTGGQPSLSNSTNNTYANPTSAAPVINAQNTGQSSLENMAMIPNTNMPNINIPSSSSMVGSQYSQNGGLSSGYPQTQNPYPVENFIYDVQRDPQNADEYYKLYQMYQEVLAQPETGGMGDLSQSSRNALASSDNAINTVNQLEQLFTNAGSGSGRIGGTIKGWAASAGFDENARIYDSLANASVTQIAKALAGSGAGTVSDMDAKVIMAALPTLRDTPAEARAKFEALRQRLDNAKQNTLLYGGAESESQSLENALMQAQGAY